MKKRKCKLTAYEKFRKSLRRCLRAQHALSDIVQQLAAEVLLIAREHADDGYTDSPGELEYIALQLSDVARKIRTGGW